MPFKDSIEGQTHHYGDGCGIKEHNMKTWEDIQKEFFENDFAQERPSLVGKWDAFKFFEKYFKEIMEEMVKSAPNYEFTKNIDWATIKTTQLPDSISRQEMLEKINKFFSE